MVRYACRIASASAPASSNSCSVAKSAARALELSWLTAHCNGPTRPLSRAARSSALRRQKIVNRAVDRSLGVMR